MSLFELGTEPLARAAYTLWRKSGHPTHRVALVGWTILFSMLLFVVVLTLPRMIKTVVTRQAPITLELRYTLEKKHKQTKVTLEPRNTPEKKHKQTKGGTAYMLRFRDSFKSYYDRRFCDSTGRAIYVPSLSRVWLPHPDTIPWVHVHKPVE